MEGSTVKRLAFALLALVVVTITLSQLSIDTSLFKDGQSVPGWWTALPPLVGIALAIATRRLIVALAVGVFAAAVLAGWPSPLQIGESFLVKYLWDSLFDWFHLAVLLFTAALLGLVSVATKSGGTHGIVAGIMQLAKTRKGARLAGYVMGLSVFFDDYANTAIVGPTVRPLFDKLKISREKLAYIMDSTAAPVAGIAIISTWVGAEAGYLQDAASALGVQTSGYALFLSALSFRFYCVFALIWVFIGAYSGRDFGPMLKAERRAFQKGEVFRPGAKLMSQQSENNEGAEPVPRAANALIPLLTVLCGIAATTYVLGKPQDISTFGFLTLEGWQRAFIAAGDMAGGNALSYVFAAWAVLGSCIAVAMAVGTKALTPMQATHAWWGGVRSMTTALLILLLAWALSAGCKEIGTAQYAAAALSGKVDSGFVPLTVFLVAGVVAFSTGTSWGTMAILIPTAAQLGFAAGGESLMIISMAAVLDGAIFGDHCSPISDTTVLSSTCSGCDHLDHVRTQAPYALLGAGVAALCGYGLVGAMGAPTLVGYGLGIVLMVVIARWLCQPVEQSA
jgi:Na+/H+ antiporter NhaC